MSSGTNFQYLWYWEKVEAKSVWIFKPSRPYLLWFSCRLSLDGTWFIVARWGITVNILLKLVGSFSPMHYWFVLSTITIACHGARPFKGHTSAQRWVTSWYRPDKLGPQWRTSPIPCPAKLLQFHRLGAPVWSLRAFRMYQGTRAKACKGGCLGQCRCDLQWPAVEVHLPRGLHTANSTSHPRQRIEVQAW